MKCPLKAGEMTLTKDVELPNQIPPVRASLLWQWILAADTDYEQGKYTVTANVLTTDDENITCLKAEVAFKPHGL